MMNSTNDGDPFIQVQEEANVLLNSTRQLFSSYLRIRSLTSSSTSPELSSARQELQTSLQELSSDLEDLQLAVSECERDPYRFGLEIEEVAKRRRWLREAEGELADMKEEIGKESNFVSGGGGGAPSKGKAPMMNGDGYGGNEAEEDSYTAFEHSHQQQLMREQDVQLDSVYRTVGNLRAQADVMGRELEEQAEILDETDRIADRVEGKLKRGLKGMNEFVKKNEDKYSSCCIAVLIFVLILLLVILLIL